MTNTEEPISEGNAENSTLAEQISKKAVGIRFFEWIGAHPLSTGVLAIVGILGFAISVLGFRLDRTDANKTTDQISTVETIVTNNSESLRNPHENFPSFVGKWNVETAFKLAWPTGTYDSNLFDEVEGGTIESTVPELERSFFIPLRDGDARILITSLTEGSCQACTRGCYSIHHRGNSNQSKSRSS